MKERPRILISCVNYNTYEQLTRFIESIRDAYILLDIKPKISILIADNSNDFICIEWELSSEDIYIQHINNKGNFGYIGGVEKALLESGVDLQHYDYFIISNVDVRLSDTFFKDLMNFEVQENIGWIAPCIFSEIEFRDRNPKIIKRPSRRKMLLTTLFYRYPVLHFLYEKAFYQARKKQQASGIRSNIIYAGHGSFMIFTRFFMRAYKSFHFPSFLFGEEIYFAELTRNAGLSVVWVPDIKILDFDHASTAKLRRKDYYKMNHDSMVIITKKYF